MPDIKEHVCPACGGTLKFNIKSQDVVCLFCDTHYGKEIFKEDDEELSDKHIESVENKELLDSLYSKEEARGMSVYACESCGGEIFTSQNTSSTTCPYCGSNVLIKSKISGNLKPKSIIPFKVTEEKANENIQAFFKKKFFVPSAFKKSLKIDQQKSLYVPYWLFSSDAYGDVDFSGKIVKTWVSGDYRYKETSYYRLEREGDIAFEYIPVDGSQHIDDALMESIEPFNVYDRECFSSGYLNGFAAERYDVDEDKCKLRANARITQGTVNALSNTISSVYEGVHATKVNIERSHEFSEYALYPVYLTNAKWKDKTYQMAVNGDTGKVAGNYPKSNGKEAMVDCLSTFGALLIGFLIGFFVADQDWLVGLILGGLFGFITALIVSIVLHKKLKKQIALNVGAASYVKKDSFNLKRKSDVFLYKDVTKVRIKSR